MSDTPPLSPSGETARLRARVAELVAANAQLGERLLEKGIDPSIGTVGDVHDNSLAESGNGLYKTELIKPRRPWRNAAHVEAESAVYAGRFNNRRIYEYCGDMPVKLEKVFYGNLKADSVA